MKTFASDNFSTVDPRVMQYLNTINEGHETSYADDTVTALATAELKKAFGEFKEAMYVTTGTAANILALKILLAYRDDAVLTSNISHVCEEETGALVATAGNQVLVLPHIGGKLTAQQIKDDVLMCRNLEFHTAQPRVVSIANTTEFGTIYTPAEVRAIADDCHELGMFLHMDGCRLPNAVAKLGVSLKELTVVAGVDVLCFGGAKNGLMNAEAVIVFNAPTPTEKFRAYQKQSLQLTSKMRYISGQFVPYMQEAIWLENATLANDRAAELQVGLAEFMDVQMTQPFESNQLFLMIDPGLRKKLGESYQFYDWNTPGEVRLVCSWDTTSEEVQDFINILKGEKS